MIKIKGLFENSGVFVRFMMLLLFMVVFSAFLTPLVSLMQWADLSFSNQLRLAQFFGGISVFLLPSLMLTFLISNGNILDDLQLTSAVTVRQVILVLTYMVLLIPFVNLLSYFNHQLIVPDLFAGIQQWIIDSEKKVSKTMELLLNNDSYAILFFNLLVICLLPAISEELFFRSVITNILKRKFSFSLAIWVSAIFFSAIHLQFFGFIPRILLGVLFSYLLSWSKSIWLPIIAHFINNSLVVLAFFFLKGTPIQKYTDELGTGNTLWLGILSGVIAVLGFLLMRKHISPKVTS